MIFKRLKKKSNQKYLNKNLNNRKPLVDDSIIQSVGVILNNNEFRDADQLLSLLRSIDIKENKIKFITLIDDHESRPNSWDAYFYPENFKWKGKIEGADLTDASLFEVTSGNVKVNADTIMPDGYRIVGRKIVNIDSTE